MAKGQQPQKSHRAFACFHTDENLDLPTVLVNR